MEDSRSLLRFAILASQSQEIPKLKQSGLFATIVLRRCARDAWVAGTGRALASAMAGFWAMRLCAQVEDLGVVSPSVWPHTWSIWRQPWGKLALPPRSTIVLPKTSAVVVLAQKSIGGRSWYLAPAMGGVSCAREEAIFSTGKANSNRGRDEQSISAGT